MELLSDKDILDTQLGTYNDSDVFIAEKIIINYLNKTPEDWDEGLSIATCEVVKRMALDKGIKSESVDNHSVTFKDIKNVNDVLGASVIALLDGYKDTPLSSGLSGSFGII